MEESVLRLTAEEAEAMSRQRGIGNHPPDPEMTHLIEKFGFDTASRMTMAEIEAYFERGTLPDPAILESDEFRGI